MCSEHSLFYPSKTTAGSVSGWKYAFQEDEVSKFQNQCLPIETLRIFSACQTEVSLCFIFLRFEVNKSKSETKQKDDLFFGPSMSVLYLKQFQLILCMLL